MRQIFHFNFKNIDNLSERLKQDATVVLDNDIDDIPVIPDLDEFQEDDLQQQVAAPPR